MKVRPLPIFCQGSRACPPFAPRLLPVPFCLPLRLSLPGGYVYPAQARFHSAKNAAVLRLQRTQSKDRRF